MPEQDTSEGKPPEDKPFPWRCPKCGEPTVKRVTMPYRCQRRHRGRSVIVEVSNLAVPHCSNCGEVVFDYLADEQIRGAFRAWLDAEAKKTQRIIKYLFSGLAFLGFAIGFILLIDGESVAAALLAVMAMIGLLAGAFADLRIRIDRVEDHLLNRSSLKQQSSVRG